MTKYLYFLSTFVLTILAVFCPGCTNPNQPTHSILTNMSGKGSPENLKFTGLYKNYHPDGYLYSETNYKNGIKEGPAKKYYENGKTHTTMYYSNGLLTDTSVWYYKSGKSYRKTPYLNGHAHGMQQKYYDDENIQAIIPFSNGHRKSGLEEYDQNHKLVSEYPDIVFFTTDYYKPSQKVFLDIQLDNKSKNVRFYFGTLHNQVFYPDSLREIYTNNGVGKLGFVRKSGYSNKKTLNIISLYRTPMGNNKILQKEYNIPYKDLEIK